MDGFFGSFDPARFLVRNRHSRFIDISVKILGGEDPAWPGCRHRLKDLGQAGYLLQGSHSSWLFPPVSGPHSYFGFIILFTYTTLCQKHSSRFRAKRFFFFRVDMSTVQEMGFYQYLTSNFEGLLSLRASRCACAFYT